MKNEKKWIVIAIVLLVMAIAVRITGNMASTKEVEKETKLEAYSAHWVHDGDDVRNAVNMILEDLVETNGSVRVYNITWNVSEGRYEIEYESGGAFGYSYIYQH